MGAVNILQGKDASFQIFLTDSLGHPVDITGWSLVRVRMPGASVPFIEKLSPLVAPVNAVQTIGFGGSPTVGGFKLQFGSQLSAVIPYTAIAADVQAVMRAFNGLKDVTVGGSFTLFTFSFVGSDGARVQPALSVVQNTLQNGPTALVATATYVTPGVPQSGVDVANAIQGNLNVVLSEVDTAALKVGMKLNFDVLVRIGSKDLNIPLIAGLLNVTKNPFE